jgi:putative ABC transport system permease protein
MMPWSLLPRHLLARPVRSLLTLGSLAIAVFLVCFLRGVVVALGAGVEAASDQRLVVQSAVSLFVNLPRSYQPKIKAVPGVRQVCKLQWFGGYYQDPSNFFAQFAVDEQLLFDAYPELVLLAGDKTAFWGQKTACLIGRDLARDFGWQVGDTVPLVGGIFARSGQNVWDFTVAGIYESRTANFDSRTMFFHYDYLADSLESGAATGPEGVGVYILKTERGSDPTRIMASVDALFANGPQRVQTTTESEFQKQFVTMLGSIPTLLSAIGGGVLFAILLAALNTMLMAARERTRTLGVLKALGFSDRAAFSLLLGESLVLCGLGGLLGLLLFIGLAPGFNQVLSQFNFPPLVVGPQTFALALSIALGVGLIAGLAPAIRAARLEAIEALNAER